MISAATEEERKDYTMLSDFLLFRMLRSSRWCRTSSEGEQQRNFLHEMIAAAIEGERIDYSTWAQSNASFGIENGTR
jgi:hypothetical protein